MKLAIMQPYFLPYLGYFQLINAVDKFVVYDNIQYTKKGWINRNRILSNGSDITFSIPLKKDSDYLDINKRFLADNSQQEKEKILRVISQNYKKASEFQIIYPLLEKIFLNEEKNLFKFILKSLLDINSFLEIETELSVSSEIYRDKKTNGKDTVMEICKSLKAQHYINPVNGKELYNKKEFQEVDLNLQFLEMGPVSYNQFNDEFVSHLSIIDILMFNKKKKVLDFLNLYYLS